MTVQPARPDEAQAQAQAQEDTQAQEEAQAQLEAQEDRWELLLPELRLLVCELPE